MTPFQGEPHMTVMDKVIELQDRVLSDMQKMQTQIVDLNKKAFEATASLPAIELPGWVPQVDDAPKPETVVGNGFDFAGKLLAANRDFSEAIVGVWTAERPVEKADAKK